MTVCCTASSKLLAGLLHSDQQKSTKVLALQPITDRNYLHPCPLAPISLLNFHRPSDPQSKPNKRNLTLTYAPTRNWLGEGILYATCPIYASELVLDVGTNLLGEWLVNSDVVAGAYALLDSGGVLRRPACH